MEQAKTCAEIAEELNSSRQNINQQLKSGLEKLYKKMLYEKKLTNSPSETLKEMINFFGVSEKDDVDEFFKILPEQIKKEVRDEHESK